MPQPTSRPTQPSFVATILSPGVVDVLRAHKITLRSVYINMADQFNWNVRTKESPNVVINTESSCGLHRSRPTGAEYGILFVMGFYFCDLAYTMYHYEGPNAEAHPSYQIKYSLNDDTIVICRPREDRLAVVEIGA